jgi:hypothetical protein
LFVSDGVEEETLTRLNEATKKCVVKLVPVFLRARLLLKIWFSAFWWQFVPGISNLETNFSPHEFHFFPILFSVFFFPSALK